jgi:hypothetical protein
MQKSHLPTFSLISYRASRALSALSALLRAFCSLPRPTGTISISRSVAPSPTRTSRADTDWFGWISYFNPANVLFQSGICLFPSGVVKPSTSITAFVLNAPLQNVGFLILQRWVFNFGTLGFLFVFFIRQSVLQPFTGLK